MSYNDAVNHGKWIKKPDGHTIILGTNNILQHIYSDYYECTNCGAQLVQVFKYDYCPACGSIMDL